MGGLAELGMGPNPITTAYDRQVALNNQQGVNQLQQASGLASLMGTMQSQALASQVAQGYASAQKVIQGPGGIEDKYNALLAIPHVGPQMAQQFAKGRKDISAINQMDLIRSQLAGINGASSAPPPSVGPAPANGIDFMAENNQAMGLPPPTPQPQAPAASPMDRYAAIKQIYLNAGDTQNANRIDQMMERARVAGVPKTATVNGQVVLLPQQAGGAVTPIYTAPKQATPIAPGTQRQMQVGSQNVTEEMQSDGTWKRVASGDKFGPTTHIVPGVDEQGNQIVSTFDRYGKPQGSTKTGALAPSWQNNANIQQRQALTSLNTAIKPHQQVLDAYQRFEDIKASGDNSQANQFLAAQISQMSRSGNTRFPKQELERILGTTFEGGDWAQRASNYVSQMATGVRTPDTDKKLSDLADVMAKSSAQRIGQEVHNAAARSPSGQPPVSQPLIYGRYIVTPTGSVFDGGTAAGARTKLDAMMKSAGGQ